MYLHNMVYKKEQRNVQSASWKIELTTIFPVQSDYLPTALAVKGQPTAVQVNQRKP